MGSQEKPELAACKARASPTLFLLISKYLTIFLFFLSSRLHLNFFFFLTLGHIWQHSGAYHKELWTICFAGELNQDWPDTRQVLNPVLSLDPRFHFRLNRMSKNFLSCENKLVNSLPLGFYLKVSVDKLQAIKNFRKKRNLI